MSGGAAVLFGMVISACGTAQNGAQPGGVHPPVTAVRYEQWKTELSNWGRWGPDDQMGALNLITPEKRKRLRWSPTASPS